MGSMFGNFGEIASLLGKVKDIQASIRQLKSELPEKEFEECMNKAKASLRALELAQEVE